METTIKRSHARANHTASIRFGVCTACGELLQKVPSIKLLAVKEYPPKMVLACVKCGIEFSRE